MRNQSRTFHFSTSNVEIFLACMTECARFYQSHQGQLVPSNLLQVSVNFYMCRGV